jgi:hypothetical protein
MKTDRNAYRYALGLALGTALILVWLSLGVGIIGADGDPANGMYAAVIAVGIIGAITARLRPGGMARTLFAMALVQAAIGAIALLLGLGYPASPPVELIGLNGMFIVLFSGSALLFRRAGRG